MRYFRALGAELLAWLLFPVAWMPGRTGVTLRAWVCRRRLAACGRGLTVGQGAEFVAPANIRVGAGTCVNALSCLNAHEGVIRIGDSVGIARNCTINAANGGLIEIGDHVMIAPNVVIRASDHGHARSDIPMQHQGHVGGVILIDRGAWIGANAVVTRNVRIGADSIVAAGAVVTGDIPAGVIAGGVPARVIRVREGAGQDRVCHSDEETAGGINRPT